MSQNYDVFISYNRAEQDRVRLLREEIERLGLSVWMDEVIEPGMEFQREIEQALHHSRCVLVAWTKGAIASNWVRGEATAGFDKQRLVSARLDDVQVPLPFNIHDVVDLTDWPSTRESDSRQLQRLLRGITTLLGRPPPAKLSAAKHENLSVRLARRVVDAITETAATRTKVTRRELRLHPQLPASTYAKLARSNALIDQMSRQSLTRAHGLAEEVVEKEPKLDDGRIARARSRYLARLLDAQTTSFGTMADEPAQQSAECLSVKALTSGDPQQVDTALTERMATPDDQSLLLFALYVLFPAGATELAQKFLNAAESANPLSAEIKFHLARSYGRLGKRDRCLRGLRDTLRMSPNAEIVVIYLTLVLIRNGNYKNASASLQIYGDVLAEPIRALLEGLVADKSMEQAGLLQERLDCVLATLQGPAHTVADVVSSTEKQAFTAPPVPERWLFDVTQRAEGYLKLVS